MPRYSVTFYIEVDADTEDEAHTQAIDAIEGFPDTTANVDLGYTVEELKEE